MSLLQGWVPRLEVLVHAELPLLLLLLLVRRLHKSLKVNLVAGLLHLPVLVDDVEGDLVEPVVGLGELLALDGGEEVTNVRPLDVLVGVEDVPGRVKGVANY